MASPPLLKMGLFTRTPTKKNIWRTSWGLATIVDNTTACLRLHHETTRGSSLLRISRAQPSVTLRSYSRRRIVALIVVKVAEVNENSHSHHQRFVLRVSDIFEIYFVVIHVRRKAELATAWNLLLYETHRVSALGIGKREINLGARPAWQRKAKPPLATTPICLQHVLPGCIPHLKREIHTRERVHDRANHFVVRYVLDFDCRTVEAAAGPREAAVHRKRLVRTATLCVEDIDIPRRTISAALLLLPLAAVGLLDGEENLGGAVVLEDFVLVRHLNLAAERRRDGLEQICLLPDLDLLAPSQAIQGHPAQKRWVWG